MMTSYLMVTKWKGDNIVEYPNKLTNLIRRVEAFGAKARILAAWYQEKLNNGVDYSVTTGRDNLLKSLKENTERFTVCAVPDSQARECFDYPTWEECPFFKPETANG